MLGPQLLGQQRLAFEADRQRLGLQRRQREDLLGDLEDRGLGPNGKVSCEPRNDRQRVRSCSGFTVLAYWIVAADGVPVPVTQKPLES